MVGQRTWWLVDLKGFRPLVLALEAVLVILVQHRELSLERHGLEQTIGGIRVIGVTTLDALHQWHIEVAGLVIGRQIGVEGVGPGALMHRILRIDRVGSLGDSLERVFFFLLGVHGITRFLQLVRNSLVQVIITNREPNIISEELLPAHPLLGVGLQ